MALMTTRRFWGWTLLFAVGALIIALLSPMFGAEAVDPFAALVEWWRLPAGAPRPVAVDIIFYLRLPRIAMAFLAGASLATVGVVFQAMLRNPLATPYTLGVASGGSFGAVVAIFLPELLPAVGFAWGPFSTVQVFAFGGSLLAVALIYLLARSGGRVTTMELLLAGVTMGMIFSALILVVRYFARPELLVDMDRWMMGRLEVDGPGSLWPVLPLLVPALAILFTLARQYDLVALGEAMAAGRGVNVARLQQWTFLAGSMATAAVVAVVGPVGFVGLIIPHTIRRLVGPDHRLLMSCSFFGGGGFLIFCDTLSRVLIPPSGMPVGVITALLGGPFFIYLLLSRRRRG